MWHGRNGYKPGTFKLDSAISEPEKGDPLSKGDKRKPQPKKALKDKDVDATRATEVDANPEGKNTATAATGKPAKPAAKKRTKSK